MDFPRTKKGRKFMLKNTPERRRMRFTKYWLKYTHTQPYDETAVRSFVYLQDADEFQEYYFFTSYDINLDTLSGWRIPHFQRVYFTPASKSNRTLVQVLGDLLSPSEVTGKWEPGKKADFIKSRHFDFLSDQIWQYKHVNAWFQVPDFKIFKKKLWFQPFSMSLPTLNGLRDDTAFVENEDSFIALITMLFPAITFLFVIFIFLRVRSIITWLLKVIERDDFLKLRGILRRLTS